MNNMPAARGAPSLCRGTDDVNDMPVDRAAPGLSRMLSLEPVQKILNVKSSVVYGLCRSGERSAAQFGGRVI